ncbi:MAG TPA: tRNA (guanosine(37)-N1)-methyltransferase TrmD [Candidatus Saccharimonadales bacterium]|nr:tRNA (guanosine(37)-N1)-methyltransferase TrmD [Candidatus Saccharimonadales bacterium]
MKIEILTLFPKMFIGPFDESMILAAKKKRLVKIKTHDLRKWAIDKRGSVDDRTYGGGKGMLIRVDVIDKALKKVTRNWLGFKKRNTKVILLDAAGEKFTQKKAQELSKVDNLILIAGHYEGIDHRVHENLVDEVISIGDYVLTGGEIPAMVLIDSVVRLIPGVLEEEATQIESHSEEGVLEYPQYTRPENYKEWKVPETLLSGNHKEIEKWRKENSAKS